MITLSKNFICLPMANVLGELGFVELTSFTLMTFVTHHTVSMTIDDEYRGRDFANVFFFVIETSTLVDLRWRTCDIRDCYAAFMYLAGRIVASRHRWLSYGKFLSWTTIKKKWSLWWKFEALPHPFSPCTRLAIWYCQILSKPPPTTSWWRIS